MIIRQRFIELPITIIDTKLQDMGLEDKGEIVPLKVKVASIEAYRKGYLDDFEGGGECTCIYLSSSESFRVSMTLKDFETALSGFIE